MLNGAECVLPVFQNMLQLCFKICFTCVSKYGSPVFQILDRDRLDPFSDRVVRSCRMVGQQVFCRRTFTLKRLHTKAFFPNSLSFAIRDLLISLFVCSFQYLVDNPESISPFLWPQIQGSIHHQFFAYLVSYHRASGGGEKKVEQEIKRGAASWQQTMGEEEIH